MNRKRFLRPHELLELAMPLYAVADGRRTRSMIDAVRDVYFQHHAGANGCGDSVWGHALDALSEATNASLVNGFQTWELQAGRTVEECRAAFQTAVSIAKQREVARREAELNTYHCDC